MTSKCKKIFLGANSTEGFVSYFKDCYDPRDGWKAYIIKGGPGTGKSHFMKTVAENAANSGFLPVLCYCGSDPDSLDGIIIEEKKTVFLDGTAPHTVDPVFPGACEEILNLGEFWNSDMLFQNREKIIDVCDRNRFFHAAAARCLSAAGQLKKDNLKTAHKALKFRKADRFADNLIKKYLKPRTCRGKRFNCFISGVTPKGVINFTDTVTEHYKETVVIEDKFGAAAAHIMQRVCTAAVAGGYSVTAVKDPFLPEEITSHVLIKELSLAFVTENDDIRFDLDTRRIHARRFYDSAVLHASRNRRLFNRRIGKALILSACENLSKAKAEHDNIESFYIKAMDFSKVRRLARKISGILFDKQ